MHDWVPGTAAGDRVSMAVPSDGSYGIPEGVISRWRTRGVRPSPDQLRRLTGPLRLALLEGLGAAGYLTAAEAALPPSPAPSLPADVERALREDPALPSDLAEALVAQYRALVAHAARDRAAD